MLLVWPSWNIILCLILLRAYRYIFLAFHVLDRLQAQVGLGRDNITLNIYIIPGLGIRLRLRWWCRIIPCCKIFLHECRPLLGVQRRLHFCKLCTSHLCNWLCNWLRAVSVLLPLFMAYHCLYSNFRLRRHGYVSSLPCWTDLSQLMVKSGLA